MAKDLRTFLQQLTKKLPNHLKVVEQSIDPKWEATAFVEKLRRDRRYPEFPAILFTNVRGSNCPLLINLCASYERLALAIDTTVGAMVPEYARREGRRIQPKHVNKKEAPVKEIIRKGNGVDLRYFPIPWHNEFDSGHYIDAAPSLIKDPDTGSINAGIYRHQVQGKNELGFMCNPAHHGSYILRRLRDLGKRSMEVAIVVGHHPAFLLSSVTSLEGIGGELDACGGLLNEPLEVVEAETLDLLVPARAEIVIEGVVATDSDSFREEGPFGEYPGYYTGVGPMPYLQVTAITSRKKPIFQTVFNAHIEHTTLGAMPRMGNLYRRVREAVPSVTMVNLPVSGMGRSHAYISLKKARDGEPKLAAFAALAVEHTIKHVFLVDDDIDVFNETDVLWCMCTRFQADRDLSVIPYSIGGHLMPNNYDINRNERTDDRHKKVMETKMILDLTKPAEPTPFPVRARVPEKVVEKVNLNSLRGCEGLGGDIF